MIDFLLKLISKNVEQRPSAEEALQHNFFKNMKEGIRYAMNKVNDVSTYSQANFLTVAHA